jgi:multiple sugar transport system substrate-binding protein
MKRLLLVALILLIALPLAFSQGKTTIRYTRWAGSQEARDFQKLIDLYNKSQSQVFVETEFLPWAAYWEKVRTTIISGDAADVISVSNVEAGPYITKGAFMDLDGMPGAKTLFAKMQPGAQLATSVGGKIKAMPIGLGVRAMVYNKAMLKAAGIPFPSPDKAMTWDEFVAMSKKLIKKEGDKIVQYPALFHLIENYEALVVQYGGKLMDNYLKPTKILINSKEGIAALARIQQLFKDDIFPPYTGEWQGAFGSPDSAVATGKVAFMHTGPWSLSAVEQAKIDYGTCPFPMQNVRSSRGYVNSLAIFRGSKKAQAAWSFISWMASVEGQLEFTKTGDLPANVEAFAKAQAASAKADVMKAYFNELPYTITGPMLPSTELSALLETVLTDLFQFRVSPEEAAKKIEDEGNRIIKKLFR